MRIIYFLSILLIANIVSAQSGNNLTVKANYFIDTNASIKLKDLLLKAVTPFPKNNNLSIGYNKNSAIWCNFKLKNNDRFNTKEVWLCFNNNHLDSVEIFDAGILSVMGDRTKQSSPFISAISYKVILQPNQEKIVTVRIKKQISFLEFSYSINDEEYLLKRSRNNIALVSFFIGMVFLLIILNTILYFFSKKKLYLYYLVYSLLSIFYLTISTNYAKHILFPGFLYFSECRIYVASLWFISIAVFLSHFLNLKKYEPKKFKIIYFINICNGIIILITLILLLQKSFYTLKFFSSLGYINFLIIIGIILWTAVLHLNINKKTALYILVAFIPQLVWATSIILKSFNIIPYKLHEDWLVIISLYEVFLFGYILAISYIETFQKNNTLIKDIIVEKEKSFHAITQAQIRERRNIANLIHDNLGSKIAYITHLLEMKRSATAVNSLTELANDIREISHKILPKSLDEGALVSSLESQIQKLNEGSFSLTIELFNYGFPEKIKSDWVFDIYLITLEIINNAVKHGKAKCIVIELFDYTTYYHFQFTDDGIGFDVNTTNKGFGLDNILRRVAYYKGSFEINSTVFEGTIVQICIPKK